MNPAYVTPNSVSFHKAKRCGKVNMPGLVEDWGGWGLGEDWQDVNPKR